MYQTRTQSTHKTPQVSVKPRAALRPHGAAHAAASSQARAHSTRTLFMEKGARLACRMPAGHEPGGAGLSLRGPDAAVPGGLVIFSSSFLRRMSLPDSGFETEASKQTNKQTGRWNGTALPHLHRD